MAEKLMEKGERIRETPLGPAYEVVDYRIPEVGEDYLIGIREEGGERCATVGTVPQDPPDWTESEVILERLPKFRIELRISRIDAGEVEWQGGGEFPVDGREDAAKTLEQKAAAAALYLREEADLREVEPEDVPEPRPADTARDTRGGPLS
jgi:hypothetical protein